MIRRIAQGLLVVGIGLTSSQARATGKASEASVADFAGDSPKIKVDLANVLKNPPSLAAAADFNVDVMKDAGPGKETCQVRVDKSGEITPAHAGANKECRPLWKVDLREGGTITLTFPPQGPLTAGTATLKVRKPVTDSAPDLKVSNDKHTIKFMKAFGAGKPATPTLYVENLTGKEPRWEPVSVGADNTTFELPAFLTVDKAPKHVTVLANFDKDGNEAYTRIDLVLKATETEFSSAVGGSSGSGGGAGVKFSDFCDRSGSTDDKQALVCADLFTDGEEPPIQIFPDTRHVLKPNRSVLVKVRHRRGSEISVKMDGRRGLFRPGIMVNVPARKDENRAEAATDEAKLSPDVVSVISFAPRLPGPADIKIKQMEGGKETSYTVELVVEETYIGAVRLGVSAVIKGAVDREYSAQARPGSQQAEIVAKSTGPVDLELVLGFAPYLFDFIEEDGRAAVTGCRRCFAPYVGLGLLNQSATSLELLKSLHFGLEWEFAPSFSVAGTFVVRRVTRLATGFEVGSPVGTDVPTTMGYSLGCGLVFNFSPEFFKVASQSSSGFFKQ
jgi:hypothetical protein